MLLTPGTYLRDSEPGPSALSPSCRRGACPPSGGLADRERDGGPLSMRGSGSDESFESFASCCGRVSVLRGATMGSASECRRSDVDGFGFGFGFGAAAAAVEDNDGMEARGGLRCYWW